MDRVNEGAAARTKKKTARYNYKAILAFKTLFLALQVVPPIASLVSYKLFFKPRSKPRRALSVPAMSTGELVINDKKISVYHGGSGPKVLVVHGWESSAARLEALITAMLDNGLHVVAFDMPAHGGSRADDTDILEVTKIIQALETTYGPFKAAVGHSFGGVCLANALREKLGVSRVVLFSTPSTFIGMVDKFCHTLGIFNPAKKGLIRAIGKRLAPHDLETDLSPQRNLTQSGIPTLVIHDKSDPVVPFGEGEDLSRAHPNVSLLATKGLGHNEVIRRRMPIQKCIAFISQ